MSLNRTTLLKSIVCYEPGFDEALKQLSALGPDPDFPMMQLGSAEVLRILDRYLDGNLTDAEVTRWAQAIEAIEELALVESDEEILSDVLLSLSSPEIDGPITARAVEAHAARLQPMSRAV